MANDGVEQHRGDSTTTITADGEQRQPDDFAASPRLTRGCRVAALYP